VVDRLLRGAVQDLGPGHIQARLYDLGDYPGAVASTRRGDRVTGRLYRLLAPLTTLARLDHYEGYDPSAEPASEFVRRPVAAARAGGPVLAWVYYYNRSVTLRRRVVPADWLAWVRRRQGRGC
jgi:gamma-glutamylcyclotransferase (GGCT)/AIG2-like uncharacterized protein YtfP